MFPIQLKIRPFAIALAAFLGVAFSAHAQGTMLLETATMGPTGPAGGIAVNNVQFIGHRFNVSADTDILRVGGHFSAGQNGAPGPIFAAIVRIDNASAFPKGTPFQPSELIATTLVTTPSGLNGSSEEVLVPMPVRLSAGDYMVVFGSGLYGATGEAGLTTVNPVTATPTFSLYLNGQWLDREVSEIGDPTKSMRIVVEAVPEPAVVGLFILGLGALLIRRTCLLNPR